MRFQVEIWLHVPELFPADFYPFSNIAAMSVHTPQDKDKHVCCTMLEKNLVNILIHILEINEFVEFCLKAILFYICLMLSNLFKDIHIFICFQFLLGR